MYSIPSRTHFCNSADTHIEDVFSGTTQANSLTAPSLSACECCNNKHTAIKYDIH
jgi:hypothetical protein